MPPASAFEETLERLEKRLGYHFSSRVHLEQALTHASFAHEDSSRDAPDYDRLEFLGDAVLGLLLAEDEFRSRPEATSGELSRGRARFAKRASLAQAGERLGLGLYARLSSAERQHGGSLRRRLLADLYEAVAGAIYLDGGIEAARAFVRQTLVESRGGGPDLSEKDPKSALQELLQGRGLPAPTYRVVETTGPPHAPTFLVEVEIDGRVAAQGRGGSKREAEQAAARSAIWPLTAHEDID